MFRFKFCESFFVVDLSKPWNLITKVQLIYLKKNDLFRLSTRNNRGFHCNGLASSFTQFMRLYDSSNTICISGLIDY